MNSENSNRQSTGEANTIILRLYVAGMTKSARVALTNLEEICETHFPGKYKIETINLRENPQVAIDEEIFAVPTVVRQLPPPLRKVIGDLSDSNEVLLGLDLLSDD